MKRYFFTVLCFSIITFAALTSQAQDATTPPPSSTTVAQGFKLIDASRGLEFTAPNSTWGLHASDHSISFNHSTLFDAHVTLKKSWYTVANSQQAYDKRKESLKSYLPGAVFVKENEAITLSDSIAAVSMTYKNPSDLKVKREIMFVHKGQAYELVFEAKEENFPSVKEDFGFILKNFRLQ